MKVLPEDTIPEDYRYYRSSFLGYGKYTRAIFRNIVQVPIKDTGFYGWISGFLFGFFSIAKFLKTPFVPDTELLRANGMKHGIVYWSPWGKIQGTLHGWKKLSPPESRGWHHAGRSAFSILDTNEYERKWSSNARNHLKQIRRNREGGKIIIKEVDIGTWISIYKKTELPHKLKGYHASVLKKLSETQGNAMRITLAYIEDTPLAGAVFLDEAPTSVYFVAFQNQAAKPFHLGLALIDWWFADSLKRGFKYLDFDHMWSPGDPESYKGYTQFKSELADYEVEFNEVWWRWF